VTTLKSIHFHIYKSSLISLWHSQDKRIFWWKNTQLFKKYNITFHNWSDLTCYFTFRSIMYKGGNRKFILFCKSTIVPTSLHCCFKFFDSDLSIPFVMIYMCFTRTFVDSFDPNQNLKLSFGLFKVAFN
jgi:hypothetical protein